MSSSPKLSLLAATLLALLAAACAKQDEAPATGPVAAAEPVATPVAATATPAATQADGAAVEPAAAAPTVSEQIAGTVQGELSQSFGQAIALAGNQQAHDYATVLGAVTGELLASDPDACARLLLPAQFGPLGWDRIPAAHRERLQALQQAIVATARTAPTPAPGEAEAGPLFDAMSERIHAAHGEQALAGVQGEAGAVPLCRSWSHIYAGLAAASAEDGGRVMRWLNAP